MSYHPENGVVLFGGADESGPFGDTWGWNGETWELLDPGDPAGITAPSARSGIMNAMVYDAARDEVLLFGGATNVAGVDDMWKWNGASWTRVPKQGLWPVRRAGHSMTFDEARGVVVLFGGVNDDRIWNYFDDTWEWDGASWQLVCDPGNPGTCPAPSAREGNGLAYHPASGIVLFAGGGSSEWRDDTWTWNGNAWSPLAPPATPPARHFTNMVYDAARQRIVVFGGDIGNYVGTNDTWKWAGVDWEEITPHDPLGGPIPRWYHSMAYDHDRGVVVLFGGFDPAALDDTWELGDTEGPRIVHAAPGVSFQQQAWSGYVDPRRESTNGVELNQGLDQITMVFSKPVRDIGGSELTAAAFVAHETGGAPPPAVMGITTSDNRTVAVHLSRIITLQEWTTIEANVEDLCGEAIQDLGNLGPGVEEPDRIDVGFLPCNTSQDSCVTPPDYTLFQCMYVQGALCSPLTKGVAEDYVDEDRDGRILPIDLLYWRMLWNGQGIATKRWFGECMNHPQP